MPEPVAIWIRARGRSSLSDCSRLVIALTLFGQRFGMSTGGSVWRRERRVEGLVSSAAGVTAPPSVWRPFDPLVEGLGLEPLGERLGAVELEDAAASGMGVEAVR